MEKNDGGWVQVCTKNVADGKPCGLQYFVHWNSFASKLKKTESAESKEPHTCRVI